MSLGMVGTMLGVLGTLCNTTVTRLHGYPTHRRRVYGFCDDAQNDGAILSVKYKKQSRVEASSVASQSVAAP